MNDIARWLEALGLAEYAPQFVENRIGLDVVGDLSDQDLKELGIAAMGDRRKLLRAAAERATTPAAAAEAAAHPPASPPQRVPASSAAERRNLTVMFCDLVGSTALAATLDPEDMREVVRAYQGACAQAIGRYEGFVAQYLGDGVMAYFGYPTAHEDDAERAVRAGLDLIAAVAALGVPGLGERGYRARKIEVRIGIATGLVVVGDLIGEHAAKERAVTGETPNLAARLQGLAAPGSIVVSAATRRLLGGMFDLHDLGPQSLKGLGAPVQAFAVEGLRSFESRFEARAGGLTGFVGREEECGHLLERWKLARQGRGQVVLVSGEAGIGKSRLTAWLADEVAAAPHMRLRYQCTPHHKDSALYPAVVQIERAAGLSLGDAPEQKLAKLETVLALARLDPAETVPLFAALLAIPIGERYSALALTPAQQRQRTMAAMLDQVEGLARRQPLLILYEDAHWADATSLELLDALVDRVAKLPVLAIITTRPEFTPAWSGRRNVSSLVLQRLDRRDAGAIVTAVTGGAQLPAEVMEQILAKTDGVPLFVEELTKAIIESGQLVEEGRSFRAAGLLPSLAIPATLQDSLMARLDRLNPVKEIAQIGAAIGREFPAKLVFAVAGMAEQVVRDALDKLEAAELATHRGARPEVTYVFKHALVRDAAYESLLKSRRQTIHRRIAKALRDQFPGLADTEPETIAHHFGAAGKNEQAADWWTRAGRVAAARGGFVEAIGHYERAIALADTLPPTPERLRLRLDLQLAYREPVIAIHGWSAQKTTDAFTRSSELAAQLDDPSQRFAGAFGILHAAWVPGGVARAVPLAEDYLRQASELGDETHIMIGHRLIGQVRLWAGEPLTAVRELQIALAAYDYKKHSELTKHHGADDRTAGQCFLSVALWQVGRVQEAHAAINAALEHSYWIKDIPSIAFALGGKSLFYFYSNNLSNLKQVSEELLEYSQKNDLIFWTIVSRVFLFACQDLFEDISRAISEIKNCLDLLNGMQYGMMNPMFYAIWANLEARRDPVMAVSIIEELLAENARSGNVSFDAALQRLRGKHLRSKRLPEGGGAEAAFQQALAIARAQGAKTYELLASLDLGRLYCDTGRQPEAVPLLQGALVGFEPTPELPEIAEAQQLLASLGGHVNGE